MVNKYSNINENNKSSKMRQMAWSQVSASAFSQTTHESQIKRNTLTW